MKLSKLLKLASAAKNITGPQRYSEMIHCFCEILGDNDMTRIYEENKSDFDIVSRKLDSFSKEMINPNRTVESISESWHDLKTTASQSLFSAALSIIELVE